MKILITGSSGLVGSALCPTLQGKGHEIIRLVRPTSRMAPCPSDVVRWNPDAGTIETEKLTKLDAVVHLAGENIASGRWNAARKQRIRESRIKGTQLLSAALASLDHPPAVYISASAIGYYGNRGDELLDEESTPGSDFLAEVCQAWEAATQPAAQRGIRVVNARFGMILSARGGALDKMLPPFRLGLGGPLGDGCQYVSWIAIDDVVGAILHALRHEELVGPVNGVAPHPVRNSQFTATLAKVLHRPAVMPVPAFGLRLMFGEMADALLLASQRVNPAKLLSTEYVFQYPMLETALGNLLHE